MSARKHGEQSIIAGLEHRHPAARWPTSAKIITALSLFAALTTGSAVASHAGGTNTISSADIIDNSVTSSDVGNYFCQTEPFPACLGGLGAEDLANGAVTGPKLADASVGTSEILNGDVGATDVGTNAIGSDELQTESVGRLEVEDDSLTGADIFDDSIAVGSLNISGMTYTAKKTVEGTGNQAAAEATCDLNTPQGGSVAISGSGTVTDKSGDGLSSYGVKPTGPTAAPKGYKVFGAVSGKWTATARVVCLKP